MKNENRLVDTFDALAHAEMIMETFLYPSAVDSIKALSVTNCLLLDIARSLRDISSGIHSLDGKT